MVKLVKFSRFDVYMYLCYVYKVVTISVAIFILIIICMCLCVFYMYDYGYMYLCVCMCVCGYLISSYLALFINHRAVFQAFIQFFRMSLVLVVH